MEDLAIFLVLKLVRELQPQLADLGQDRIGEKPLENLVRRADDIAGEQGAPLALRRKRPLMAAVGIVAVAAARWRISAVERHDDAAERDAALRSRVAIGFNQPGLGDEEIVGPSPVITLPVNRLKPLRPAQPAERCDPPPYQIRSIKPLA